MTAPRRTTPATGPWAGLADTLARRRRELGLTQQETADLSDLSEKALRDIESGSTAPRLDTLVSLTESLGLDLAITDRTAGPSGQERIVVRIRREPG